MRAHQREAGSIRDDGGDGLHGESGRFQYIVFPMAQRDADNLISKLRAMGEEGISSFFSDVMSNDRLRSGFGKAGQRFMENKQTFDRNVETVLDFVNIPTKKDVRDLKQRLDHLSSQLLNLNIKLDRILAEGGEQKLTVAKPRPRKKD
jgi:polyhydroxyalkanoate synthesis regulator phasin